MAIIAESRSAEQGPKLGTPLAEGQVMGPAPGAQGCPQAAQGRAQDQLSQAQDCTATAQ